MNTTFRRIVAVGTVLTTLNLGLAASFAAERQPTGRQPSIQRSAAPKIISTAISLSPQELAQYQRKTAQAQKAANHEAAGASGDKTVWVIVGVAALVGVIALASSGGGGGGY